MDAVNLPVKKQIEPTAETERLESHKTSLNVFASSSVMSTLFGSEAGLDGSCDHFSSVRLQSKVEQLQIFYKRFRLISCSYYGRADGCDRKHVAVKSNNIFKCVIWRGEERYCIISDICTLTGAVTKRV